uniref:Uncharacterized protein n=1 Tax=mine drainage metagenome TaxID=410659 RepID=E6QUP7_9ZZZZ
MRLQDAMKYLVSAQSRWFFVLRLCATGGL